MLEYDYWVAWLDPVRMGKCKSVPGMIGKARRSCMAERTPEEEDVVLAVGPAGDPAQWGWKIPGIMATAAVTLRRSETAHVHQRLVSRVGTMANVGTRTCDRK